MRYSRRLTPTIRTNSAFDQLSHYVNEFYSHYSHQTLLQTLHKETYFIEWHCYECKKQISVDIRPLLKKSSSFKSSSLFCSNHKVDAAKSMKSHIFVRYESSFYSSIKHKIYNTVFDDLL